jgi:hypothetical protein
MGMRYCFACYAAPYLAACLPSKFASKKKIKQLFGFYDMRNPVQRVGNINFFPFSSYFSLLFKASVKALGQSHRLVSRSWNQVTDFKRHVCHNFFFFVIFGVPAKKPKKNLQLGAVLVVTESKELND